MANRKSLNYVTLLFVIAGQISCAAPESKPKQEGVAVAASASKPKLSTAKTYGIPIGTFICKKKGEMDISFKIFDATQYQTIGGKNGAYSVLNDDLIFFKNENLKGYFGHIKGPKEIQIFKGHGNQNRMFKCTMQ